MRNLEDEWRQETHVFNLHKYWMCRKALQVNLILPLDSQQVQLQRVKAEEKLYPGSGRSVRTTVLPL